MNEKKTGNKLEEKTIGNKNKRTEGITKQEKK